MSNKKALEELGVDPSTSDILYPFMASVPDSASNDDYAEYIQAVLEGERKQFKDWKASQ